MRQYETTFIVDPVLSDEEIKSTLQTYQEMLKNEGCEIVHTEEMGLRQLAYPIKRRNSGVYYCLEFKLDSPSFIDKLELSLRRDERVMRFLTISLDRFGVKYNEDKRNGLIGKRKKEEEKTEETKVEKAPKAVADEKEVIQKVEAAKEELAAVSVAAAADAVVNQEEE
jgi:small subunit ribosomal protein S6